MDGEFIKTPCQNFEEVPQILASTETASNKPPLNMASLKDARAVVEEGGCTNWGQLPDFSHKIDKFGLGFTTGAQRAVRRCCTPKFVLPYFSKHFKKDPQVAQGSPRVDRTNSLLRQSTSN